MKDNIQKFPLSGIHLIKINDQLTLKFVGKLADSECIMATSPKLIISEVKPSLIDITTK